MRTIIFANGDCPTPRTAARYVQAGDWIVCADGGARHALALGLRPAVVIGDFDSLDKSTLAHLQALGARLIVHPADKDETDLELALALAAQEGAMEIIVLGGLGGRLDQTLANVLLLTLPQLAGIAVRIVDETQEAFLIRGAAVLQGNVGDILSLIPLGGDAGGMVTEGLRYPLRHEPLRFGPARGLSNVFTAPVAHVSVRQGMVLAIHMRINNDQEVLCGSGG
jgi:thiamine pyrophosphokinase